MKDNPDLFDSQPYHGTPPHVAKDTSIQAAEDISSAAAGLRRRVFHYVEGFGPYGCICDEVEAGLDLRHQTASARIRELVLLGKLRDSGRRRKTRSSRNAAVWVAA